MVWGCAGSTTAAWFTGNRALDTVPSLDSVGLFSDCVLMAAAAVPVARTAARANEVPNFVFMSQN